MIKNLLMGVAHYPLMAPADEGAGGGGGQGGGDAGAGAGDQGGAAGAGAGGDGGGQGDAGAQGGQGGDAGKGGDAGAGAGDQGGAGDGKAKETPAFAENWRETLAMGADGKVDDKKLAALKRFNSPHDLHNSYAALRQKIDSGEFKKPLGKDAKPEEIAAWRKDNGIPEKPEAYLDSLPKGLEFSDDDKAAIEPFLKDMHDQNVPPGAVHAALLNYKASEQVRMEAIQTSDSEIAANTEDTLRAKWGGDYRANMASVQGLIDSQFPADVKEALMSARLGDDKQTPLLHHPAILEAFATMGRYMNPQGTLTHGSNTDTMATIEEQIASYEKRMGTKDWFKDDKAQSHYRELITVRDRMKSGGK